MMRGVLSALSVFSLIFFPWMYTLGLVLVTAWYEPFIPLAVGLLADVLYYVPQTSVWPWGTIGGASLTLVTLFVQSRLMAGTIR